AEVAASTASKAAVAALTVALAEEVVNSDILVNAIAPSTMDTPANRQAMPDADPAAWAKVEDVAAMILFLASPENRVTRGAVVPVYGRSYREHAVGHYGELLRRWDSITRRRTEEPRHGGRSNDGMLLCVRFVVLLDVLKIVKIIDHQPIRLLQRSFRGIAEEVEPLEPRAVAEVEASDRIKRRAAGGARAQIIPGSRAQQWLLNHPGGRLVPPPLGTVERCKRRAILRPEHNRSCIGALALEPVGEVRGRRQRNEGRQTRDFTADLLDDLLDEKVTKGHPSKPALAVGDRIEHRRRRSLGFDPFALCRQNRIDRRRNAAGKRDFDEDQRFIGQRRMKERVAT